MMQHKGIPKTKTVFFAVGVAAISLAGAACADAVTGRWKVSGDIAGNPIEIVCTFAGAADKTTVTCSGGKEAPAKVTGKDVTWDFDATQAVLTFKGTLDTDKTMKGDIEVQGVTGSFTAARQ